MKTSFLLLPVLILLIVCVSCVKMQTDYAPLRQQVLERTPELVTPPTTPLPAILTLEYAKELALRENPSLAALQHRIESARLRYQQAYSAYMPQLSAQLSARHFRKTPETQVFGGTTFNTRSEPYEDYSGNLTLSYLLFDGFTRDYTALAALYGMDVATAAREDAQRVIARAVSQFFFTALLAQKRMEIARADQDFNGSFMEDARKRREQGAASRADVLNFQIRHDNARIAFLDARTDYRIALIVLAELMGYPGARVEDGVTLTEPSIDGIATPDLVEAVSIALVRRPDLKQIMANVRAGEALVLARKGLFYPRLFADARLVYSHPEAELSRDDFGVSFGLTGTYDFLDGGAVWYARKEAQALVRAANQELEANWQGIISQIRQELENLRNAQEKTTIQRNIVEATRIIREDVEQGYRAGQLSLTRLNEVQRDLTVADENLAVDLIQILLARENLAAAIGNNVPATP